MDPIQDLIGRFRLSAIQDPKINMILFQDVHFDHGCGTPKKRKEGGDSARSAPGVVGEPGVVPEGGGGSFGVQILNN